MTSKRILITGLSTYWGGRLAQALEQDPAVEAIIGVDKRPPKVALERTEFVRVEDHHSLIRRIVQAAEIDTVVDTRLVADSIVTSPRLAHENNVIGTMNVLAACGGPDSFVKKVVFKSTARYYGCEQDDPAFFTERMRRPHPPRTSIERDVVEAESAVQEFKERNPETVVTTLRFANGLGPAVRTTWTRYLGLPVVPTVLGFDPRQQFLHEDDIAGVLEHAVRHELDGMYNAAADGVLVLSEVIDLLGKSAAPILPPFATALALPLAKRLGLPLSADMLQVLRFGRGMDNRKLKATGYRYRYTTRETVLKLREHQRLRPLTRGAGEGYRYEEEVESFLRRSPSVRITRQLRAQLEVEAPANLSPGSVREPTAPGGAVASAPNFADLHAREVIALLGDLDVAGLRALREHEASAAARKTVLAAIDGLLVREQAGA